MLSIDQSLGVTLEVTICFPGFCPILPTWRRFIYNLKLSKPFKGQCIPARNSIRWKVLWNYVVFNSLKPRRVGLVVSESSHVVGRGFAPRSGHTKDHHKYGTYCISVVHTYALAEKFDSAARLSKRPDSVRDSRSRVGYCNPVPEFYLVLHGLWCRKCAVMDQSINKKSEFQLDLWILYTNATHSFDNITTILTERRPTEKTSWTNNMIRGRVWLRTCFILYFNTLKYSNVSPFVVRAFQKRLQIRNPIHIMKEPLFGNPWPKGGGASTNMQWFWVFLTALICMCVWQSAAIFNSTDYYESKFPDAWGSDKRGYVYIRMGQSSSFSSHWNQWYNYCFI